MTNLSKLGKLISVDLWSAEAGLYIFLLVDLLQAQQEFVICVEALCHDRRTAKREIVSNAGREHAKSLRVYPCLGPSNLSATRILQNNKSCRLSVPCCRILQNIKCRPSVLCRRVSRAARGRPAAEFSRAARTSDTLSRYIWASVPQTDLACLGLRGIPFLYAAGMRAFTRSCTCSVASVLAWA
jgi:hypothetical protein